MKTIVAKFHCESVLKSSNAETPRFRAVSGEESKPWSKFTPSGTLEMQITNPECFGAFAPGQDYYLELRAVEAPEST